MIKRGYQSMAAKKIILHNTHKLVQQLLTSQLKTTKFNTVIFQDKVYLNKNPFLNLPKLRVLRQGIQIGELRKERLEPYQHFYTAAVLQGLYHHVILLKQNNT